MSSAVPFKICSGCGVSYTRNAWQRLPFVGAWVPERDDARSREVHEQRNCPSCQSTVHAVLVEHGQDVVGGAALSALVGLVYRVQRELSRARAQLREQERASEDLRKSARVAIDLCKRTREALALSERIVDRARADLTAFRERRLALESVAAKARAMCAGGSREIAHAELMAALDEIDRLDDAHAAEGRTG